MSVVTEKKFQSHGFKCEVKLIDFGARWPGHRCGYVTIPRAHPIVQNDDVEGLEVHGGVTYGEPHDAFYTIGFDCAHGGDTPDRWTLAAVRAETEKLAEQIANYA
jgi:hypothetical protein